MSPKNGPFLEGTYACVINTEVVYQCIVFLPLETSTLPSMEPIASPLSARRGAAWLNGSIWASILAAFAYTLVLQDYKLSLPFLHALALIVVGLLANLLVCLWLYATGRRHQAKPYLLSFITLMLVGVGVGVWVLFFDECGGC